MTEELKPCPFCGGKVGWDNGSIYCPKCNFRFRPSWSGEICVRRWNRRGGYGIGDERWHYCPSCGAEVVDE